MTSRSLPKNTKKIVSLSLGMNQIGDTGAFALVDALKDSITIRYLYLFDNLVGDAGAIAIAKAKPCHAAPRSESIAPAASIMHGNAIAGLNGSRYPGKLMRIIVSSASASFGVAGTDCQ